MPVAQHRISENAERFLARTRHSLLIDGELVAAVAGKLIEVRNPSTGEVLGHLAAGDAKDMDKAVKAARAAFDDPTAVDDYLPDDSDEEARYRRLCLGSGGLLVVIYTEREQDDGSVRYRIISAWKANRNDQARYNAG